MRLVALVFAAILVAAPSGAQDQTVSHPQATPSLNLPVSLDKIREALKQPAPAAPLKGLDETPTFRVEVRERQAIDDLLKSMKFDSGPAVPGGLYAYEQQRQIFPSTEQPLGQPYAAFTGSEMVQVTITSILEKIMADKLVHAFTSAERARAIAEAKDEVNREIAKYCAAQPNNGAGIQICASSPAVR